MQKLLDGKVAVVTGSNRGIGKALVQAFAEHGAEVWACARKPDDRFSEFLADTARRSAMELHPVYFDLADTQAIKDGAKQITAQAKKIDIIVNNAGTIHTALFQMTPLEKQKELFDINFFGPVLLTQQLVRKMVSQRSGSIINLSSSAAFEGNEGRSTYAATKSALMSVTLVMSRELGPLNIRVNAIAPGLTETDMLASNHKPEVIEKGRDRTSLRRLGRPEEIAGCAVFLASDLSSFVTGQTLRADGGL